MTWRIASRVLAASFLLVTVLFGWTFFAHGQLRGVEIFQPDRGAMIIFTGLAVALPLWAGGRLGWLLFSLIGVGWFLWSTLPAIHHVPLYAILPFSVPGLLPLVALIWRWRHIRWLRMK